MDAIENGEALWRARVGKVLKGEPFESLVSRIADDIEIQPLYPAGEAKGLALRQHAERPWRIVQRVDHPEVAAANELALADLTGGADTLKLVFRGSPFARGFGVLPQDLSAVLAGVELDLIALSLDPEPGAERDAIEALAGVVSAQRLVPATLDVDFGLDPIGAMAASGMACEDWETRTGDLVRLTLAKGFAGPALRADTRAHHEAGASPAEELGAALATGLAYLRLLERAGIGLEDGRRLISFQMPADADQFVTLAKFRALRRLWAAIERECGLEPAPVRLSAETSFRMATRRDAAVNWLRTTGALFAAGTGGADQICVLPHTIALGLPDGFSRRIARNQQLVLLSESHLGHVGDPGAGAGAVEALTDALVQRGWAAMQDIEAADGMVCALRAGSWQRRIAASLERRRADLADGRAMLLGVTAFVDRAERAQAVLLPMPPAAPVDGLDFAALRPVRDEDLIAEREDAA